MPMPWKKSKSGGISKLVSDLQQSPKHGGSLVVETGFPTSLIDLFVKNRDRLKKSSSKRNHNKPPVAPPSASLALSPPRRRVSSPPPLPPLHRHRSLPVLKLDPDSVTEPLAVVTNEESFVGGGDGVAPENKHANKECDGGNGGNSGGGGCGLMVVAFKVFVVAVLALSTKKLAVGITLSAFALLFLEFAVARVLTLLNLCPGAKVRLHSLFRKLIGTRRQEKIESSYSTTCETRNNVTFEIGEESEEDQVDQLYCEIPLEEKEAETVRDVVVKMEKSKSSKLKSRIVKKIVPKKIRSYKKKRKLKKMMKKEGQEGVVVEEEEEDGSVTEGSSLYSEDRMESELSDEISSNPPLLESCDEEEECGGTKGDMKKAMVLIVTVLVGLLGGKVVAICMTLTCCLILRLVCCKPQTSLC